MGDVTAAAPPSPDKSSNLFMQIAVHPDGTITRPFVPDAPPSATGLVLSRDVPLDTSPTSSRHRRRRQSSPFVLFSTGNVFYHASVRPWPRPCQPSSSGGNMALNAGVRACRGLDLGPAAVRGLVLHQPYLGGVARTPSEEKSGDDAVLPLEANDKLWSLALPAGADRDHEFSNPAKSMAAAAAALTGLPRCLVTGSDGDPLIDRQRELVAWLRGHGVEVVAKTDFAGSHAAELFVKETADELFAAVRAFVSCAGDVVHS
uniref:Alpha/beta hydrolase fold-3 domain-containing protein n=1 Tax=Oryza barthii TaxID=65489 RepID=A0A0D3H2W0_9ORYZ